MAGSKIGAQNALDREILATLALNPDTPVSWDHFRTAVQCDVIQLYQRLSALRVDRQIFLTRSQGWLLTPYGKEHV